MDDVKTGLELIAAERQRQVTEKHWGPDHDDHHLDGDLAIEGARWACEGTRFASPAMGMCGTAEKRASKPRLRQLAIAGALIAAEIDRLQRLQAQG